MNDRNQLPWYRHPHLWLVLVLPVVAVVVSMTYLVISYQRVDDAVRDDWYMDGKTLRQDLSRDSLAKDLGLMADVTVTPTGQVDVTFKSAQAVQWPPQLHLNFYHPVKAAQDIAITLRHGADGHYRGQSAALPRAQGRYHAELANGTSWRLQQAVHLPFARLTMRPLARIS